MENQSTDDNSTKPVQAKVACRKCGGPHFTIKCGKESDKNKSDGSKNPDKNKSDGLKNPDKNKSDGSKNPDKKFRFNDKPYEKKPYFKTTYRVKISELPTDMTEEEMMELTCNWGHLVRIRVINYSDSSVAYIDFGYEEEADYFVKAIDKTTFQFLVISAQRVESFRPDNKL